MTIFQGRIREAMRTRLPTFNPIYPRLIPFTHFYPRLPLFAHFYPLSLPFNRVYQHLHVYLYGGLTLNHHIQKRTFIHLSYTGLFLLFLAVCSFPTFIHFYSLSTAFTTIYLYIRIRDRTWNHYIFRDWQPLTSAIRDFFYCSLLVVRSTTPSIQLSSPQIDTRSDK